MVEKVVGPGVLGGGALHPRVSRFFGEAPAWQAPRRAALVSTASRERSLGQAQLNAPMLKLARTLQSRRVRGALAPKTIAMPYVRFGEPHSSGVRLTSVTTSQLRTFWV
jgi:hypothetical protein